MKSDASKISRVEEDQRTRVDGESRHNHNTNMAERPKPTGILRTHARTKCDRRYTPTSRRRSRVSLAAAEARPDYFPRAWISVRNSRRNSSKSRSVVQPGGRTLGDSESQSESERRFGSRDSEYFHFRQNSESDSRTPTHKPNPRLRSAPWTH
jgi:hypothetical protein